MKKSDLKNLVKEEYHNVKSFMEEKYGFIPELGKVISNPYATSFVNEAKEPEVITTLRKIVKNKQNDSIKDTKSGKKVRVDMNSANLMVQVYDALKQQSNKDKFVKSGIVMMGHMAYKLMKKESVNEGKYDGMLDVIEDLVSKAKSFMDVGNQLKKHKVKYSFSTSMIPMYKLDKLPIAIVNKKYVDKADREVGDIAIGLMESIKESVNEGKFYITRNLGRGQGKALVGGYDLKRDKKLPPKVFKSYRDAEKEVKRLERGGSMGGQMTAYIITDKDMNMLKPNGKKMFESLTEGKKKLPKFKNIPSWAKYVAQSSDGEWTWYEDVPTMIKFRDGSGGAWKQDGNQTYTGVKTNGKDWDKIPTYYNVKNGKITESAEQIDEKLITFSGRAPYGQAVFMAGGAGSGKGFAIDNFVDAAGFKVRDVDEMKNAIAKLDQLGKFTVDKWYKKYGKKLSDKPNKNGGLSPKAHVEEFMLGKGLTISDIANPKHKLGGLKNPNNVASLHYIVDSMGLKDKWVINMLSGKKNKETLPNLLFDITAKKVASITDVIKPLEEAGYDSKNIHLIWVLSDYYIAVDRNKDRDRVVPDDILLQTHEGAGKTMWTILTKALPKGLNGRIDVILNNSENTIYHIQPSIRKSDDDGEKFGDSPTLKGGPEKVGVVSGFLSLPIKKQGGGIASEKDWKLQLFKWIGKNAPNTLDLSQNVTESVNEVKDNLYLQLHKKYAEQIKGLKAKKIKKLSDLVWVQRRSMSDRGDYFDMDSKKKKELSAEYRIERSLLKKYMARDYSVMLPKGTEKLPESVNEENDTYFKTAGEAVDFAKTKAEKKGYEIDEDDWNNQITHGGRYSRLRPSVGKTHTFQIGLLKKGKPQRKGLSISLFGMDSGKYELTHYIN